VEHLFFDLDHTLWDFERCSAETLTELFEEYRLNRFSISVEEFKSAFKQVNGRLWDLYNHHYITRDYIRQERFALVFEALGIDRRETPTELSREYLYRCPRKTHLESHSLQVLKVLQPHYKLHIITNGFDDVQKIKMESAGILHFFDVIATSESSGGYKKPDKQMFEHALSQAKVSPSQTWMIGDNLQTDIVGAQAMGMKTIYYNPIRQKHHEQPDAEITSLLEIIKVLAIR